MPDKISICPTCGVPCSHYAKRDGRFEIIHGARNNPTRICFADRVPKVIAADHYVRPSRVYFSIKYLTGTQKPENGRYHLPGLVSFNSVYPTYSACGSLFISGGGMILNSGVRYVIIEEAEELGLLSCKQCFR